MEILRHLVLLLHFIGFASLLGGALVQMRSRPRIINPAMVHGVWTQFVTGLILVGLAEYRASQVADFQVDHMKVGIKLVVLLVILVIVLVNRRKERISDGVFWSIFGLTIVDAAVAVFM